MEPVRGLIFRHTAHVLYDGTLWRCGPLQLLSRLGVNDDYRTFYEAWDRDYLLELVRRGRGEFVEAFQAFLFASGLNGRKSTKWKLALASVARSWTTTCVHSPVCQRRCGDWPTKAFRWSC